MKCGVTAVFLGLSAIACHSSPTLSDAGVDAAAADVGTDQGLSEAAFDAADEEDASADDGPGDANVSEGSVPALCCACSAPIIHCDQGDATFWSCECAGLNGSCTCTQNIPFGGVCMGTVAPCADW